MEGDQEKTDGEGEQGGGADDVTWVRIHPEDRLWLDEEIARLGRERYRRTRSLQRPSIKETLRDVVREVKDARERIPELESTIDQLRAENDRLEERLSRCSCTSHDGGPDRDAHQGHQPGPTSPVDSDDAGAAGGLTLA